MVKTLKKYFQLLSLLTASKPIYFLHCLEKNSKLLFILRPTVEFVEKKDKGLESYSFKCFKRDEKSVYLKKKPIKCSKILFEVPPPHIGFVTLSELIFSSCTLISFYEIPIFAFVIFLSKYIFSKFILCFMREESN